MWCQAAPLGYLFQKQALSLSWSQDAFPQIHSIFTLLNPWILHIYREYTAQEDIIFINRNKKQTDKQLNSSNHHAYLSYKDNRIDKWQNLHFDLTRVSLHTLSISLVMTWCCTIPTTWRPTEGMTGMEGFRLLFLSRKFLSLIHTFPHSHFHSLPRSTSLFHSTYTETKKKTKFNKFFYAEDMGRHNKQSSW